MSGHPNPIALMPHDLGLKRTVMAADRTLMAWIRTSLSMVSFGFTIYKFLDAMAQNGEIARTDSPQRVGMFLCGLGAAAVVLGTISYWVGLKDLNQIEKFRMGRPVLIMALIMSLTAIAMVVGIGNRLV